MPTAEQNRALFAVPMNSEFWAGCDDMQDAELVGRVQPQYPGSARQKRESGTAMFYAVIEEDGTLSRLKLFNK
jgi:hypothetical protein